MRTMVGRRGMALAAILATGVLAAGCATGGGAGEADAPRRVTVLVDNNNWQDANIYVVGVGPRVRLGTVESMTSKRFVVPPTAQRPEGLQLEADLLGSSVRKATNRIMVNPGEEVRWTLENQLALSSYSVW